MKTFSKLALTVCAIAAFSMFSCEQCTTCTYTFEANGQTISAEQPEFCGSKSEVNDYKDASQAAAEQAASLAGGVSATSTCVDN